MKQTNIIAGMLLSVTSCAGNAEENKRPNIIIILADDMGYSDAGCYGGEIETPNIDRLAHNGLRYRQFYNCARSCPTRASLLTGLYPHQAGMGWMAAADMQRAPYQGYLNNQCVTIADVMRSAGYSTYMTGKWHVGSDRQNKGAVKDNWPLQRGFDRYFGIVEGATNYFDVHYTNDNEQHQSPTDGSFYFTHAVSDSASTFISRHDFDNKPLFLYLAYTSPHWPLHALQQDIEKYADRYKAGWDKLREERFKRQKEAGLFASDAILSPRDADVPAWNDMSDSLKNEFAMRMAIYAAQIDAMDQGIGRVIASLQQRGELDNTVIFFLSDNGACAEFISSGKRKQLDGKVDTYESYRINWANMSSTPFREYKHFTNEGGIATPLIVHYPKGIARQLNNSFTSDYGHLTDIMATCVDLAKATYPATFKGNNIVPMQGISLTPNFKGNKLNRTKPVFWEHEANIAMRDGKWKIVTKTKEREQFDPSSVKLYDMEADPTEMNDLSKTEPARTAAMYAAWNEWAQSIGALPLDTRDYGERQRAYKRVINGEFDDNFGDWGTHCGENAKASFAIETAQPISGKKSARIDIAQKGPKPAAIRLQWVLRLEENENISLGFKSKADRNTKMFFRVERNDEPQIKLLDKEINLSQSVENHVFNNIKVDRVGQYRIVFYLGNTDGSILIDDVKLIIK
ncbi:MAG: arylsulfatase [Tannerella sp.]|jgi:arylsulfatase|nr:arylsulfatase [Tannerella sp.]